jgi:hypothetical protein
MQVCYQLSNTKKVGMTTVVYFQQMKGYADTMGSLGHPLSDEEIIGYIQSSANNAGRQPADPRGALPAHGGFGHGGQCRGNSGQGRGNGGRGGGKPTCLVCGKYGHDALRCGQRFNHAFQPEENRDHAGNAVTSSYTVNTNWYMDNSANDHFTSDLDHLSLHERYTGKDNV